MLCHILTIHPSKSTIRLTISSNTRAPHVLHKAQNTVRSRPLQHDFENTSCYSFWAANHVNSNVFYQNPIHTQKASATEIFPTLKDASNHRLRAPKTVPNGTAHRQISWNMKPRPFQSNRYLREHLHISNLHPSKNTIRWTISSNPGEIYNPRHSNPIAIYESTCTPPLYTLQNTRYVWRFRQTHGPKMHFTKCRIQCGVGPSNTVSKTHCATAFWPQTM